MFWDKLDVQSDDHICKVESLDQSRSGSPTWPVARPFKISKRRVSNVGEFETGYPKYLIQHPWPMMSSKQEELKAAVENSVLPGAMTAQCQCQCAKNNMRHQP